MAMRSVYLPEDRPDIKYAAKEPARLMQTPCAFGYNALKHMVCYLFGRPRLVQQFVRQHPQSYAGVLCAANHAGWLRTRKLT
eukprot:5254433-Karenia_brevis.AAC.1